MQKETATRKLSIAVQPYLFFWEEWIASDYCNLDSANITLINDYIKRNFKFLEESENYVFSEVEKINSALKKLQSGYQIFKSLVIVNFLWKIANLANNYAGGYESFLTTPIHELKISEDQKRCYMNFKTYNLQQLFQFYKEDYFLHETCFTNIVEFQKISNANVEILTT